MDEDKFDFSSSEITNYPPALLQCNKVRYSQSLDDEINLEIENEEQITNISVYAGCSGFLSSFLSSTCFLGTMPELQMKTQADRSCPISHQSD